MDLKGELGKVTDRATWASRGASLVAKVKATKAVWFPPKPAGATKKAVSAGKKTTKKAAKKTSGTAKKATNS